MDIEVSVFEQNEISRLRFEGKNNTLKRRAMVIYMKMNSKLTNVEIALSVGVSADNVTDTIKGFVKHGLSYLQESNYKGSTSELDEYQEIIVNEFRNNPPKNIDEAIIRIKELTGITRTANPLRLWLKKTGLDLLNPELFPAKRTKMPNKGFWIHNSNLC